MAAVLLIASGLVLSLNCRSLPCGTKWHTPQYAATEVTTHGARVSLIEHLYTRARNLESESKAECVDAYFRVASLTCASNQERRSRARRTIELHRSALVVVGERFGRLDPASGLTVKTSAGTSFVPLKKTGFVWQSSDFNDLVPVGVFSTNVLTRAYCNSGMGVPLVVLRTACGDQRFMRKESAFSATLVMRNASGCGANDCVLKHADAEHTDVIQARQRPTLELLDSPRIRKIQIDGETGRLARDLSAPLVYRLTTAPRNYWQEFVRPDSGLSEGKLQMLEPYQQGKIPVVFIHGLLSDPYTWSQMVNELLARPDFFNRFQIWVYNYPTGRAFISSATKLRIDLTAIRQRLDPDRSNPALSEMVLVGHSLGGLLAKLQVTSGQDELWNSVGNRPMDELNLPEQFREELRQHFYFSPSPDVKRVVFMGTPHRGSAYAKRCVGKLTSELVQRPLNERAKHQVMIDCNPRVFSKEVSTRIPASIDLCGPRESIAAINRPTRSQSRCQIALRYW